MINSFILQNINGSGYLEPDAGLTVEVYNFHSSDVADSPPNGSKIGDASEIGSTGQYEISMSESKKVTVVVGGNCRAGLIGVLFDGDKALNDSVDTSAIEDDAVTPDKTSFGESW